MTKVFYVTHLLLAFVFATGCKDKNVELTVVNRMSQVLLQDVRWTEHYVAYNLLPGQSATFRRQCYDSEKEWPKKGTIEFTMTLSGKIIYLKTIEEIRLDCNEYLKFEITDSTEVEIF